MMENLMSKLKKLPLTVWMVVVYAALFLRDLTSNLTLGRGMLKDLVTDLSSQMPDIKDALFNFLQLDWLIWILSAAFALALFEIALTLIISLAQQRRSLKVFKSEIVKEVHIFFAAGTLIAALLSTLMLVVPKAYAEYWSSFVEVLVYPAIYAFYYYTRGRHCIVYGWKSGIWKLVSTFIAVFIMIPAVFNLFDLFTADAKVTADIVMNVLIFAVSALDTAAIFMLQKKILKEERDNPPPPPPIAEEEKSEVFKGFGF